MENDETYYDDIYFRNAYIDRSIYVTKLKRWFEIFPKEQFLIIQSEEFSKDPSKAVSYTHLTLPTNREV